MAGESLNRQDESKLSSVRFLLFPLVWLRQPIGEIFKGTDGACADPDTRIFPAAGGGSAACQFKTSNVYVTHRFFVTFLVRPALLPYGKRGFRAAIYKIARPQPPAAAL